MLELVTDPQEEKREKPVDMTVIRFVFFNILIISAMMRFLIDNDIRIRILIQTHVYIFRSNYD